jgi:integrase/recombinase XerD
MSQLLRHAEDYLALRRSLGFKLAKEGRLLPGFAAFAETRGAGTVTVDLALGWALLPPGASPVWAAQRLTMLRGFARYLQTVDPAAQLPPADLLPGRIRRVSPYIYSDADITALSVDSRLKAGLIALAACLAGQLEWHESIID